MEKGIILMGGRATRLYPLSSATNKHLLPVGNKPMIYYPIEKLTKAGIHDILIITGVEHMGSVFSLLGSGKNFNCDFTYKVQDEAGGIAQALALGEAFTNEKSCCVLLGDNIFQDSLADLIENFSTGARVFLKEVTDPQRFGVAEIEGDKVISIEEKPLQPRSNFAVTGVYCYDNKVFDFIKKLKPSKRGELEITSVNNMYLEQNALSYSILNGWWSDAGTFESLHSVNNLVNCSKVY